MSGRNGWLGEDAADRCRLQTPSFTASGYQANQNIRSVGIEGEKVLACGLRKSATKIQNRFEHTMSLLFANPCDLVSDPLHHLLQ